jgi:hypothetical protein
MKEIVLKAMSFHPQIPERVLHPVDFRVVSSIERELSAYNFGADVRITRSSNNFALLRPNISGYGNDRKLWIVLFDLYLTGPY